jgi:GR25 family glycosyltransferase involved in LPS biosynthesis
MSNKIDRVVYINLNKRVDRKELMENELGKFVLKYERFEAIETSGVGALGCGYSHLEILKNARENRYRNILILEDDFTFLVNKEEFEKELSDFFNTYPDFDICMLSYNLNKSETTNYSNILRVLDAQTTSGYIVNQKFYDKLINLYEEATSVLKSGGSQTVYSIDQFWKRLQPTHNWYCLTKRIGKQRPGYSDIEKRNVDYDC